MVEAEATGAVIRKIDPPSFDILQGGQASPLKGASFDFEVKENRLSTDVSLPSTGKQRRARPVPAGLCGESTDTWDQAYRRWSPARRSPPAALPLVRWVVAPLREVSLARA